MWLRQSTASQEILLGRFVDSTDGDTEETGLTIANTDIKIWKEGATALASKNSGGATHIANGIYYAVLDATDTDTLGKMEVHVHVSGALAVKREFMVLPANVYDSLVAGSDLLDVGLVEALDTQAITDVGSGVDGSTAASNVATALTSLDALDATLGTPANTVSDDIAAVKTDTGNLVSRITSTLFSGITSLAQWLGLIAGKQTGNSTARTELRATGAGSGTFDETTDSQEALRDRGDAAWITATGFSTLDAAGVRTAVGLASANLDTQLAALPTAAENADAVWDETLSGHLGAGSTGNALNAAGSAGDPWATSLPGAYGSGTAGKIIGDNLNATVSSRSSHSAADVWAVGTRTITGGNVTQINGSANAAAVLGQWLAGGATGTVASTTTSGADFDAGTALPEGFNFTGATVLMFRSGAVQWVSSIDNIDSGSPNQIIIRHTFSDMANGGTAYSPQVGDVWVVVPQRTPWSDAVGYVELTNYANIADSVWLAQTSSMTDAGSFGKLIGDNLDAAQSTIIGYIDTEVAAIKAKTDNLPASPAATSDIPTAAAIADAVLDEPTSGHATAGTLGKAVADILDDTGTSGVVLTSSERDSIAAALLDLANGVETSVTVRQALKAMAAVLAGQSSGVDSGSPVYKAMANSSTTRVSATASSGNRTSVTLNV